MSDDLPDACEDLAAAARHLYSLLGILRAVSYADHTLHQAQEYYQTRTRAEAAILAALGRLPDERLLWALRVIQALPSTLHEAARRVSWLRGGFGVLLRPDRDLLEVLPPVFELVQQVAIDLGCQLEFSAEPEPDTQERLTDRERQYLELWHQGRSYREIAEAMGVNAETVKRAILALRKRLGPDEVPYRRSR